MGYARFGPDSDVYVYESEHGWTCCRCDFHSEPGRAVSPNFQKIEEIIVHLCEHRAAGHKVPDKAIKELETERNQLNSGSET